MTKIRANVSATAAGATPPTSPMLGDGLSGLGSFGPVYVAPYDTHHIWPCPWSSLPLGWTNGGSAETTGRLIWFNGCECQDCKPTPTFGNFFEQICPEDLVDCAAIDPSAAKFDHGITPDVVVPGCKVALDPRVACDAHHPVSCQLQVAVGSTDSPCWPTTPFATSNPSMACRVVDDTSGPVGFENDPAMEIDFSGAGDEGATFLGPNGGKSSSRCDGQESSATQGFALGTDVRSNSGLTLITNDEWITLFAVKAVPDPETGFVCAGYHLTTTQGFFPYATANTVLDGARTIVLDGTWQTYYMKWRWNGPNMNNAPFSILTPTAPGVNGCGQFVATGRIHVKNVALIPPGAGVRMRRTEYIGGGV